MNRTNKGFVVSAVLYPLLILFLALMMGLLSMSDTRKRILDRMKLEITDSIFNEATCSCDTILNKLNYIIQNGKYCSDSNIGNLRITAYDTYEEIPKNGNTDNDIAVVTTVPIEGYVLSATKPKRDTEGELWIFVDETAPNSIDTTYSNVPIAYIKQYIGGKWTTIVSAIYDGTMWKQLNYTEVETATPATIVSGKTANVNGQRITGTLNTGASYFNFSNQTNNPAKNEDDIKLRNRNITFGYQKRVSTHEYDTLYAYWENDSGAKIELPIKVSASAYAIDAVAAKSFTMFHIKEAVQISDKVVALFFEREIYYDKDNITTTVNDFYQQYTTTVFVATFIANATTLTQVSDGAYSVSPISSDGTAISYLNNYWDRSYLAASSVSNFEIGNWSSDYIERNTFVYNYGIDEWNNRSLNYKYYKFIFESWYSKMDSLAAIPNTSSKEINYLAHTSVGINYTSGAVSVNRGGGFYAGTTYYSAADPERYSGNTAFENINENTLAVTTYNNSYHDVEVSTIFYDTFQGLNVVSLTSSDYISSQLYEANRLSYKYVNPYLQRYMYDFDVTYTSDKKFKIDITELQLPYNNYFVTAALAKNIHSKQTTFDLSNLVPDDENYIGSNSYISYTTGEIYYILKFTSGELYLIVSLDDDDTCFAETEACLRPSISFASWRNNDYTGKMISSRRLPIDAGSGYQYFYDINFYR